VRFGKDEGVQVTNDDANISKASAAKLGYYDDPFVQVFVGPNSQRRAPLINRGYYARVQAITSIIRSFLKGGLAGRKENEPAQIVAYGGGFDTTFFRLAQSGELENVKYFEVDFQEVVIRKLKAVAKVDSMMELIQNAQIKDDFSALQADNYAVTSGDLRKMNDVVQSLTDCGFSSSAPTLFLSECVLVYLEADDADAVIEWSAKNTERSVFVTYEQIRPDDAFGAVMMDNLKRRGCPLKSVTKYKTLEDLKARYLSLGFHEVQPRDMNDIGTDPLIFPLDEQRRVARLEIFDEFEEWHLFAAHYAITVAVKEKQNEE